MKQRAADRLPWQRVTARRFVTHAFTTTEEARHRQSTIQAGAFPLLGLANAHRLYLRQSLLDK